jgi:hypothetical protein
MTTAVAVAAVIAFGFALGSLTRYVDGATLRRWRLSRRWDVSRLAREFIAAADEPLATLHGLTHMINAWERGARRPSERYWLLYLRVFPECVNAETVNGDQDGAGEPRGITGAGTAEAAAFGSARTGDADDLRALAATVRTLEQQIARLSRRLDTLSRHQNAEGQARDGSEQGKTGARYRRPNWTPLLTVLLPAL